MKVPVLISSRHYAKPYELEASVSKPDSLFAVVKMQNAKGYSIVHRASGFFVMSLLPSKSFGQRELLAVVKAWESHSELEIEKSMGADSVEFGKGFKNPPSAAVVSAMRSIACDVVA